jgi:hypothetical protein
MSKLPLKSYVPALHPRFDRLSKFTLLLLARDLSMTLGVTHPMIIKRLGPPSLSLSNRALEDFYSSDEHLP